MNAIRLFFLLTILFTNCISIRGYSQSSTCKKALMIIKTAEKYHYEPKAIDDNFSKLVFNEFMDFLDPKKLYFTKEEVTELEAFKNSIDDEILEQNCSFIEKITSLYAKKHSFADSLINTFKTRKFNFSQNETITFKEKEEFVCHDELVEKWRKLVKIEILYTYFNSEEEGENLEKLSPEKLAKIQKQIIDGESCMIKSETNHSGGIEEYVGSQFLQAIAYTFDPHTSYFTPAKENNFSRRLSKESLSFGLEVGNNDLGEIEIHGIMPGSSAWNSGKLNEGDIILKVETSKGEIKDFNCLSTEEVIYFMAAADIKEATFFIRKMNGEEISLMLKKGRIDVQDNVIESFILEGEKKIGYIYLPSFYSQMDNVDYLPNGCANDVAKELLKLKREGINGLILDLRNNGGGSMLEAIRMAGIFIDYGAISIIHTRDEKPVTLKDIDRGTIYNDPLIVLINEFSASASELFAAAMQDHNRGLLVGARSYGKSTAQEIVPIDAYNYENQTNLKKDPDGYLKLTKSKFYRVTGKSHQKEGVIPDITLPSIYDKIEIGEASNPSALSQTSIEKKTYYYPKDSLPVAELRNLSEIRVKADLAFSAIEKRSVELAEEEDEITISLNLKVFRDYYFSDEEEENEELRTEKNTFFTVKNPSYMKGISSINDSGEEVNKYIMLDIENSNYIKEAYNIIFDLLNSYKN